jgi:branched-chain amino acid transport system ATP-binding protein
MPDLLVATGLTKRYGGVVAVSDVSLRVPTGGHILGLIGPNGAGKSTTINLLSGVETPDVGSIFFAGDDIKDLDASRRSRLGIARTFQASLAFADATVHQNLRRAAVAATADGQWWKDVYARRAEHKAHLAEAERILDWLDLWHWRDTLARDLPYGTLRLMSIAMAMVGTPRIVLLDEPAAGLNDTETDHLRSVIEKLAATGMAIILVEHDVRLVMAVSSSVLVLDAGKPISFGAPSDVRQDSLVIKAFLGGGGDEAEHD